MADHRVTDLSYGHLGKAIYDHENKSWNFSVDTHHELYVRLVEKLKKCVAFSPFEDEPEGEAVPSVLAQSQMRWLYKSYPEMLPASESISTYLKTSTMDSALAVHEGCLLTVARAKDTSRISGSHRPLILAFSSGQSGHVLHLSRPKPETRGWRNKNDAKLKMFDLGSIEHGYWTGTGGAIRQIASADEEGRRVDPWLAVRQDAMITILQPVYGKPPTNLIGHTDASHSSLLQPNPVVSLTPDRTLSRAHVDFSFNPFYPRQFAVVDDSGRWSIWNVENLHAKGNSHILVPGRNGGISEEQPKDVEVLKGSSDSGNADGWHKVLWACNVNIIVICGRRRLALYNVESNPERLHSPDFLPVKGNDWIIDVVRSPTNPNHLYVLTTSRIYWIKVISTGGEDDSTKVILSYRHFRDANDETMRLTAATEGHVSVTITSSKSPLVNMYSFRTDSTSEVGSQSSLTLQYPEGEDAPGRYFRGICLLPCAYVSGDSIHGSDMHIQAQEDIAFYQLWGLTINSGIFSGLCAAQCPSPVGTLQTIQAPDKWSRHASRSRGTRIVEDDFIVSDKLSENPKNVFGKDIQSPRTAAKDNIRLRVDWSAVFKRAFIAYDASDIPNSTQTVPELLERVTDTIAKALEEEMMPMDTIANTAQLDKSSGELGEAASALNDFLKSLNMDNDPESTSKLVVSDLTNCPGTKDLLGTDLTKVDLFKVHEQLVKYWITNLPLNVSNPARLAKFKIIRQLGVEMSLNSVGVSLQNKASSATNVPVTAPEEEDHLFDKDNEAVTRDSSPGVFSSQPQSTLGQDMYSSLLTPSRTPSIYSHATSAAPELGEDPAVSRLRQYAVSIKARPDPGKSSLLAHWPSQPGADPATYSYEAVQKKAAEEDSGHESERRNRKEEARRRKRTEKFLRQERERVRATRASASSMSQQPLVGLPSGSQPEVYDTGMSSQVADELPMTQPVGGTHGSRSVSKAKKQKRQRKAGF